MDNLEKSLAANESPKKTKLRLYLGISEIIDLISDSLILADTPNLGSSFKSAERLD